MSAELFDNTQLFEDSPNSDTKMDISEATTSQDSPIISPDTDDQQQQQELQTQPRSISRLSDFNHRHQTAPNECHGISEKESHETLSKASQSTTVTTNTLKALHGTPLDNRKCDLKEENDEKPFSSFRTLSSFSSCSALTLTNCHPLMSPKNQDSDSESSPRKMFNYPDVVPSTEPLCHVSPCSSMNAMNTTLDILTDSYRGPMENTDEESSPEYPSSNDDSEPDLSQYQANVTPLFQSVALVSLSTNKSDIEPIILSRKLRSKKSNKIPDDGSSVETLSDQSFDHDFDDNDEQNLVSASVSSSVLDDAGYNPDETIAGTPGTTCLPMDSIQQYSAVDEARDSRNWQKITLPDGKTRDIDMKVIEPYKRVLSHGGYLSSGGHNAIVVFSACHLPDRSRTDYHYVMDNLFLYVVKTLEQLVTEDYVLVYLHGGSSRSNVPPFPWLKKCYQLIDRRLRKSLRNLFMVHPTFWLKSIVWMARPFISSKFWRKLIYVRTLDELYNLVPLERAAVPDKVKKYDIKYT